MTTKFLCNVVNRRVAEHTHQQGCSPPGGQDKAFIATLAYNVLKMERKL